MNSQRLRIVGTALLALIAASAGYLLGHRTSTDSHPDENAPGEMTKERKILYWHDPMVPGTRFDKPGKSPFMDMQLVPVYADDVSETRVRIAANVQQNLGIRLGKVERLEHAPKVQAVGSVVFDERLQEVVQSRVGGSVVELHIKAPLIGVRRGQALLESLAPDWLAAQQEYLALLDAPAAAAAVRDAARQRLSVLGVPESAIRALEKDRKATPSTTITAPIDGVVTELAVREGSTFAAGAALMRINGLTTVWVNAQIPEGHVSLLPKQSAVTVHAKAWPGESFEGQVLALLPDVDPLTRTLTARIAVENPDRRLSPGMFVSLTFQAPKNAPQLAVPSEAVIVTGERSVVIVKRDDGAFEVATVTVGTEANGMSTILSGVEEGQSIVLSGQFLLDSEASLRSTVDRLRSSAATSTREHP